MLPVRNFAILSLLFCIPAMTQKIGAAARQQDLDSIANKLPSLHPDFFFQLDKAQFQQAVSNLSAKISSATDAEFYAGLAQIVAMAGDPHTVLYLDDQYARSLGFHTLPISLIALDDGMFVTAALQPYARAVGTKLESVNGVPIDSVVEQLETVFAHDNDQWGRYRAAQYLSSQQVLQGLHIAPPDSATPMTFRTLAGEEFTLQIAPGDGALATEPDARSGPVQGYLQNSGLNYWYSYEPENRFLYFKYNKCYDDPSNPFAGFAAKVLATLDSNPVDTFVWDFRGNNGGYSSLIGPLASGLIPRIAALLANPRFRLYVAIDKGTFSAATDNAMAVKQPLPQFSPRIRVIGEPTGGKPAGYGNVLGYNLPASLLLLQYSTLFISNPAWIPDLPTFAPDIAISVRSTDYFARYDPVLAAILARTDSPPSRPTGNVITVNGASFRVDQGLAPGSFASAFGAFGQSPDQVLVAGAEAQIVSATSSQVNFVVPVSAIPGRATVLVRAAGIEIASGQATIEPTGPGIFILNPADPQQPGAVENQDFSVNSSANPARPGSVVQLFATGYGSAGVQVFFGDRPAAVQFSGPIAQYPGLWQVNAVVPDGITGEVPVFLISGSLASNAATIHVQ